MTTPQDSELIERLSSHDVIAAHPLVTAQLLEDSSAALTQRNKELAEARTALENSVPRSRWEVTCDQYNVAKARGDAIAANAEKIIDDMQAELTKSNIGVQVLQGQLNEARAQLAAAQAKVIEKCAIAAWLHLMDKSRNSGITPAVNPEFTVCAAIRALNPPAEGEDRG